MSLVLLIALGSFVWLGTMHVSDWRMARRELGRFSEASNLSLFGDLSQQINGLLVKLAEKRKKKNLNAAEIRAEQEKAKRLREAGLESSEAQGKFLLLKIFCYFGFPALGAISYFYFIPYYATVTTVLCTGAGFCVPHFWLKARAAKRLEDIQRELPLVLDLTNLGTSAGWDVGSALERVIDAIYPEFPDHPLIKELRKARWLSASGYTWEEALQNISDRLGDDTVRRTTMALSQAIKQGGDRTVQLENIATDAQRIYYTELDKRLASLQVKGLLVTMLLFLSYFLILLAPAMISIKDVALNLN